LFLFDSHQSLYCRVAVVPQMSINQSPVAMTSRASPHTLVAHTMQTRWWQYIHVTNLVTASCVVVRFPAGSALEGRIHIDSSSPPLTVQCIRIVSSCSSPLHPAPPLHRPLPPPSLYSPCSVCVQPCLALAPSVSYLQEPNNSGQRLPLESRVLPPYFHQKS